MSPNRIRGLTFQRRFVEPILAGQKTATVRSRRRSPKVAPGEEIELCTHWSRPFARAEVTDCRVVPVAELTDADARRDGFADRAELVAAVAELYPGVAEVRVIGFRLRAQGEREPGA